MSASGKALAALVLLTAWGCAAWSPARRIYDRYARLGGERVAAELAAWEGVTGSAADDATRAGAHLRLALLRSHPDNPEPEYGRALADLEAYQALDPDGGEDPEVRRLHGLLDDLQRCILRGERRKEVSDLLWKEEQEVRRRLEALRRDSRGMGAVLESLVEEERALSRHNEELERRTRELSLRNEELTRRGEESARRARELERDAEAATQENRELKETLERLKSLDLQLERMRSGAGAR